MTGSGVNGTGFVNGFEFTSLMLEAQEDFTMTNHIDDARIDADGGKAADFSEFDLTIHDHEGDDLIRALWAEMRQLRLDMAPMMAHFSNVYAESVNGRKEELPIAFPGHRVLTANGITAVNEIPRTMGGIRRLDGMDDNTAMDIANAVSKHVQAGN